jgi:fido (protein-threonine AMPylation protein)
MSPEDSGDLGRYCQYRRSEDPESARLRLRLGAETASEYEDAYQRSQEARAAA